MTTTEANASLNDHYRNDFDAPEREESFLSVPRQCHRVSRDEPLVMRHPSIDIPFSYPPNAHPDVIAELTNDDLNIHLQNISLHTVEQRETYHQGPQQRQKPQQKQQQQDQPNPQRKLGLQEIDSTLLDNDIFALHPVIEKWIDCGNGALPSSTASPHSEGIVPELKVTDAEGGENVRKLSKRMNDMCLLVRNHLEEVENRLFEMFGDRENQTININKFLTGLMAAGLRPTDPRLMEMRRNLKKVRERLTSADPQALDVDYETFMEIISENLEIIVKAFSSCFAIPDFKSFCLDIEEIYNNCRTNSEGKAAQYIPQLARANPNHWGVSVCTVDGQRFSLGDTNVPFTIQSCCKPLNYAIALGLTDTDRIHKFVGMEPSGRYFNELVLDYNNKPHNPMINAGAIMTAALLKPELSSADRFDYLFNMYKRLVAGEYLGFNNAVFLSERECADRNFALAYYMRENKCFPPATRLHETLDFYFQLCSLEITAESGALIAATLANGGINPLTGDPVLTVEAVRNTLTLMHSCGMYNYSGQFAFKVGLPSKSGVSGCVLVVVPNTMGICLWSPPLDTNGNSCRGVQFCMELVSRFKFHNFDNFRGYICTKTDPRVALAESKAQMLFDLLFSAASGDLSAMRRHSLSGTDLEAKDYDGRTALHVAASEGHYNIVEYLLINCQVYPLPKDRWDRTPLDEAKSFEYHKCAALLEAVCQKRGIPLVSQLNDSVRNE